MPKNKDIKSGSQSNMGDKPDREFEGQGTNPGSGKTDKDGKHAGGSQPNTDDDNMTSGGRRGQFSDTSGDKEGHWSPGSSSTSDQ